MVIKNYGQHAATMAGMSQTHGDWVVTVDENGAHDPSTISDLLDTALDQGATVSELQPDKVLIWMCLEAGLQEKSNTS